MNQVRTIETTHMILASRVFPGFLEDVSGSFDAAGAPGELHVLDVHLWEKGPFTFNYTIAPGKQAPKPV